MTRTLLVLSLLAGCGGDGSSATDGGADLARATGDAGGTYSPSVTQHHNSARRTGLYVDRALTPASAASTHRDPSFDVAVDGAVKAQPLYLAPASGRQRGLLFVATETNRVYAVDEAGAVVWSRSLGAAVALSNLPCGNIDPLGVTGTPILDEATRRLYVAAMTTPDGGKSVVHQVFAFAADDGTPVAGWPVDVAAKVPGFTSPVENQRGALALFGGALYVPYGGHYGDCGSYHGWVVAIPLASPQSPTAWATAAVGGGVWSVGGVVSDGTSAFVSTGNTAGASTWGGGEAVIRLGAGATFSGQPRDYFAPASWKALDAGDTDIGSASPLLLEVPGATPKTILFQQGKNQTAYLLDPASLGGIGGGLSSTNNVSTGETVGAPAGYTTPSGTFVAALGPCASGSLIGLQISAAAPPKASAVWCADQHGDGSPIVTSPDGASGFVVWALGAATESGPGDNRLYAFDGASGKVILDGGGAGDALPGNVARFATPIVVNGKIYAASTRHLSRFVP